MAEAINPDDMWANIINEAGKDIEFPVGYDDISGDTESVTSPALAEIYEKVKHLPSWQDFWTLVCSLNVSAAHQAELAARGDMEFVFLSATETAAAIALEAKKQGL